MKKKYIIITTITLAVLIAFITYSNILKGNEVYEEENISKPIKIAKGISMNLEQTAGTGDYLTVNQSEWPTEGYILNTELSKCENGGEISWSTAKKKVVILGNISDKCYIYFDKIAALTAYVKAKYTGSQGENGIYYHDSTLTNGAGDNSYRYAGPSDSVNNFVCFGSDETTCPTDNLYRIIGLINEKVKLIKYDCASRNLLGTNGEYPYNTTPPSTYQGALTKIDYYTINSSSESNVWSESPLNKTSLNINFINNIGATWASKIISTTWKVGGNTDLNISYAIPKTAYQYEIGSSASSTTYDAKIGLMYVSDYYYGASPNAWTLVGYNSSDATKDYRAATSTNWLFLGSAEWTISRYSDSTDRAFIVLSAGYVNSDYVYNSSYAVRPSFNLESSTTYVSGSGSMSDPVRIK